MAEIITIPKKLAQKGAFVLLPKTQYEALLKLQKRLLWKQADTDEAIRIYEKERREGKLKIARDFASILGKKKGSRKSS